MIRQSKATHRLDGPDFVDVSAVGAICYEDDVPDAPTPFLADNEAFFTQTLPGRDEPLGSPGGAVKFGPLGPGFTGTPLVAGRPRAEIALGA